VLSDNVKVTSASPSVSLSLVFKRFIAAKLSSTQNIYVINTIVGTVHIYLKQFAAN